MDNQTHLIQWNCCSAVAKKHEIIHLINKFNPFLLAIQETWLKPDSVFKISNYSCVREDRSDGYAGVALLVKHSTPYSFFHLPPHSPDFSIVAIKIQDICFVSLYIPHPSSTIFSEINSIFAILPSPFIVLGDYNAHHQSWGSSVTNSYGVAVLDMVESLNLCIVNSGAVTRRTPPNIGASAPDLSICSPSLAASLSWQVLSSSFGSDHFPILLSLPLQNNDIPKRTPRLKYRLDDADWSLFRSHLELKVASLPAIIHGNEDSCSQALARAIIEAADEIFPVKNGSRGRIPSPPWWDQECSDAIRSRKEAELAYYEFSSEENFDSVIEAIKNTKKLFKKKKFESWRSFCLSLSPDVRPSVVWRNIRRFRSGFRESHSMYLPPFLADEFLNRLAPPSAPELISLPLLAPSDRGELNNIFSIFELKGALSDLKDSAPGSDGIPYSFIVNLSDELLNYYLSLINSIVISGNIPLSWKTQEVLPILKPNKDPALSSSYRPIALSSVLMKIAEHLVKHRLEWFLESRGLLSSNQFGFRRGRSTIDSLSIFITDIRLAFSCNESVVAAFLDVTAAYDNVIISVLLEKLQALSVPPILINFIINMLSERCIKLKISESSTESRLAWRGLPQGSVLSPILYNVYSSDLENALNGTVYVLQYADDLLLYSSRRSVEEASSSLSLSLNLLRDWLHRNGLELSPSKSSVVVFSRKRILPPISVSYGNDFIPVKVNAKVLGVILDQKLSGVDHCDYVISKCERTLNILRCLSGVWWGAHPFTLKLLYNALIRSLLDYGTFLLEPGSVVAFKKLDDIQAKALRLISGCMKSSPINCLQLECGDPPLQIRRQYLSDKFVFRCFQLSNHPLRSKLELLSDYCRTSNYWANKTLPCLVVSYQRFLSFQAPIHSSSILTLFDADYECLVLSPEVILDLGVNKDVIEPNVTFNFIKNQDWKDWHHIYTDASKLETSGPVGVGVYHAQFNIVQKIKFPPETSVFTGECYGLFRALDYIWTFKLNKTVIFTDSKSTLQTLLKYPFKIKTMYPVIIEIRKLLYKCCQAGCRVRFAWIPGHQYIDGNDKADELAKEAVECGDLVPYKNFCHDLAAIPAITLRKSWNDVWTRTSKVKGKYYAAIQTSIPIKPWFYKLKLGKRAASCLIRMRLGHTCCPARLAQFGIIESGLCECGLDIGDINHLFLACPLRDSKSLYSNLLSVPVSLPTCIPTLLSSGNPIIYKILSQYIFINDIKV